MSWVGTQPRIRCTVLALAGLVAPVAAPLLAGHLAGAVLPWGVALAVVAGPVGFVICTSAFLSRRAQMLAVAIPAVIAAVYFTAWETRTDVARSLDVWLVAAAIGAAALVLADRVKPSGLHKLVLVCAALVWWTSWGLAIVAASVPPPDEGIWMTCASNLKQIGVARLEYEGKFGKKPGSLHDLAEAGLLPKEFRACPSGMPYVEISNRGRTSDYVLMCPRHKPYVLLMKADSHVLRFTPVSDRLREVR